MEIGNTYPQIIFSSEIRNILERRPLEPTEPKVPEQKHVRPWIIILLLVGLLFSFLILKFGVINSFKGGEVVVGIIASVFLLLLCVCLFVALLTIYDATIGNKIRIKQWKGEYRHWEDQHEQWEKNIARIKNDENNRLAKKEQKEQILSYLSNRIAPEFYNCHEIEIVKKGISEKWFYHIIKDKIESIGGVVLPDLKIMIFSEKPYNGHSVLSQLLEDTNNPHYYYPDIAIIINNLYIDVEIDEPYSIESRMPVHYIESDDYRNNYISSHGWEVIRFAEEQIVKYPDECLKTIINTINHILEGRCGNQITDKNESWVISCWDEASARKMASEKYRETYLYDADGNLNFNNPIVTINT